MTTSSELLRGIRVIRQLNGAGDAPWPGTLVQVPSGETRLLVAATALGDDWAGWAAAPDGHVLAPLDVHRRADGHDVLLPVCLERLDDVIARREASGAALTDGERLTVAVSALRGLAELAALRAGGATGEWWITDDARPVFAVRAASDSAADVTAALLRSLAVGSAQLGEELDSAARLTSEAQRIVRELPRLEERLFARAAAEPLATTAFAPRRAWAHSVNSAEIPPDDARVGLWVGLARHVDVDVADLVSRATTGVWRRLRSRPAAGRRKGPWLLATGLIAAIVGGAVLLPPAVGEGAPTPAASASPTSHPADEAPSAAPAAEAPSAAPAVPDDLVAVASGLLDARRACEADAACLAGVMEDAARPVPAGPVDLPAEERSVALLDAFGGAAVLRVDSDSATQFVVIVRHDERWLLRDVHGVTEQP